MTRVLSLSALIVLAGLAAACSKSPTAPTASTTSTGSTASTPDAPTTYSATLLPTNEVPAVTGREAAGSATATVTINLTKDARGTVTAASLDATVTASGFPAGTELTASQIDLGAADANGVFVSLGLTPGEVTFPTGSGSFSKRGVTLTVDQANTIVANPGEFYLNIHTAGNPNGGARGQLVRN